jgi:hypothetical protein
MPLADAVAFCRRPRPFRASSSGPPADDEDTVFISIRTLDFPNPVDAGRAANIRQLELHVSRDGGKNWQLATVASPEQRYIRYVAPRDGLYLFSLRVVWKSGTVDPPDPSKAPPGLKIRVRAE